MSFAAWSQTDDYLTKPCRTSEMKARLRTGHRILQLEDKLIEAREKMHFKATHDSLTSLWDRGAMMSLLRGELARSSRDNSCVSIFLATWIASRKSMMSTVTRRATMFCSTFHGKCLIQ